jgi:beta-phosphoglucomutase-like phosphatase (HAD superfamily)
MHIWARPRTQHRAVQRSLAAQGFVVKRALARAVIFDFNGTLSDDEPVICRIVMELFAEQGRPLSAQEYYDEFAGLSDDEIVRKWLGRDDPALIEERIARYCAAVSDGSTISETTREAVRYAAERVPVVVVTGAARVELDPVVAGAGLADVLTTIVSADDVANGKPHPEGYLRALELLDGVAASEIAVFEDTEAGVAAAKAAGMHVLALLGTLAPERLAAADEIVSGLDVDLVRRLVG